MKKGRFSEAQMVGILYEADREPVAQDAKKQGYEQWRQHYNSVRPHSCLINMMPAA